MDSVEKHLHAKSESSAPTSITSLISSLSTSLVYTDPGNVETNKKLWNAYAEDWQPDRDWVETMAGHVDIDTSELECLGDEWSKKEHLQAVIDDFILPYVHDKSVCAEIGSGGGRLATKVAKMVRLLHCFDISEGMLKICREQCANQGNVECHTLVADNGRVNFEKVGWNMICDL